MRCKACNRPLSNPVSIQHGYGPDCLKRAVQAGTAPLEALEEFTAWKKAQPKRKAVEQVKAVCSNTPDLFDSLRDQAIQLLNAAAEDCRAVGLTVTIEIRS
jgi:hypothetical protein